MDLSNFILPDDARPPEMTSVRLADGVTKYSGHKKGLGFRFFIWREYHQLKSQLSGSEVYDEKEMIEYFIDRKTKGHFIIDDRIRREHFDAYDRFKKGLEAPGLSLAHWDAVGTEEIEILAKEGIFSVEQLASLPRSRVEGRFPPRVIEAFERSIRYVGSKDTDKAMGQHADQLATLAQQNAKLQAELDQTRAMVSALIEGEPEPTPEELEPIPSDSFDVKRGRGRPKKIVTDEVN